MLTWWLRIFLIKWSLTSKVIEGHLYFSNCNFTKTSFIQNLILLKIRSLLCWKIFFLQYVYLFKIWSIQNFLRMITFQKFDLGYYWTFFLEILQDIHNFYLSIRTLRWTLFKLPVSNFIFLKSLSALGEGWFRGVQV